MAQQAFDTLEPGGYFESQEFDAYLGCDDGTLDPEGPYARWVTDMRNAGQIVDRPLMTGVKLKEMYERVGFVDVQEVWFKIPSNGWAKDETLKEVGTIWEKNLVAGLSGLSLSLLNRAYDRSAAEIEVRIHSFVGNSGKQTRAHSRRFESPCTGFVPLLTFFFFNAGVAG